MNRFVSGGWRRRTSILCLAAAISGGATACRDSKLPTERLSATTAQIGDDWVMTIAASSVTKPSGPLAHPTHFDSSPASVTLASSMRHFGTTRSKFYKTCTATLPDGTRISAVLSSPDEAGLRGEGKTVRLALFASGVPRLTMEYAKHQSGDHWIVDAARFTLHDERGQQVAHGMFQRNGSSLASLARRWRTGGIADATTIVPFHTLASPAAGPAQLTDAEIASTYCATESAATLTAGSAAAATSFAFFSKAAPCLATLLDIGSAAYAAFNGDWSQALTTDMSGIQDCVDAKDAFGPMTSAASTLASAMAALTTCIAEHSTVVRIITTYIVMPEGDGGGSQDCTRWSEGLYDDNWDWVEESFWTDCYVM